MHSHPCPVTPQLPSWPHLGASELVCQEGPRHSGREGVAPFLPAPGLCLLHRPLSPSLVSGKPAGLTVIHPPLLWPGQRGSRLLWLLVAARAVKMVGGVWCFGPERCPSSQGLPATGSATKAGRPLLPGSGGRANPASHADWAPPLAATRVISPFGYLTPVAESQPPCLGLVGSGCWRRGRGPPGHGAGDRHARFWESQVSVLWSALGLQTGG